MLPYGLFRLFCRRYQPRQLLFIGLVLASIVVGIFVVLASGGGLFFGPFLSTKLLFREPIISRPISKMIYKQDEQACRQPLLQPDSNWTPVGGWKSMDCSQNTPSQVKVDSAKGLVYVDVLEVENITCGYSNVNVYSDFKVDIDKANYRPLVPSRTWIPCPSNAFHVRCSKLTEDGENSTMIYSETFRCYANRLDVQEQVEKINVQKPQGVSGFEERLNIFLLGFDSMSRVSWLEQLPKSTAYFLNSMDGVVQEGYNIVGDGTTAAMLGILTGFQEEELPESRRGFPTAQYVDDFPFIWKRLQSEAGYASLWDEDSPWTGTFQYRLLGFSKPPVDYYGRIFQLALSAETPASWDCYGIIPSVVEMIQQIRTFCQAFPDPIRKFGMIFHSIYSHSSLDSGHQSLHKVDEHLLDELKFLDSNQLLNNSVFILFSDHGSRFGGSRATTRGKISERMPFLGIALPKWFKEKYPQAISNLKASTSRLTTPFDLHATLLDIAGLAPSPTTPNRGVSLLKQPVPISRTCSNAGVAPHWCSCLDSSDNVELKLNHPLVKRCLDKFKDVVAELLKPVQEQCFQIETMKPFMAKRMSLRREVVEFVQTIDGHGRTPLFNNSALGGVDEEYVQLSFKTEPCGGEWEATFIHRFGLIDELSLNPKQISRTNKYGAAPQCIQWAYPHLRSYCCCKNSTKIANRPAS